MTSFDGYDAETAFEESARHLRRDIEADLRDLIEIVANAKQMPLSNSAPVSYTHLDVYKRQPRRCPESSAWTSRAAAGASL